MLLWDDIPIYDEGKLQYCLLTKILWQEYAFQALCALLIERCLQFICGYNTESTYKDVFGPSYFQDSF